MPSPIILGFGQKKTLSSMNSIVVGGGVTWGTATIPLVPLLFTPERIGDVLGPNFIDANYNGGRLPIDIKQFYDDRYTRFGTGTQHQFWGPTAPIDKKVMGVAYGLGVGSGAIVGNILVKAIKLLLNFFSTVNLTIIQDKILSSVSDSASYNSLIHGINGESTYNMDVSALSTTDNNILIINAGVGALVQGSVNILFIGKFPSIKTIKFPEHMLWNVAKAILTPFGKFDVVVDMLKFDAEVIAYFLQVQKHARAYAIITDASYGVILPGATISIFGS